MVRQIILAGFVVFLPAGLGAQGHGAITEDRSGRHATIQRTTWIEFSIAGVKAIFSRVPA